MTMSYGLKLLCALTSAACLATSAMAATSSSSSSRSKASVSKSAKAKVKASSRSKAVKVAKLGHDMRFDIPIIGERTFTMLKKAKISCLAVEASRTILLAREKLVAEADRRGSFPASC